MPEVSVIIPVYNAKAYLRQCVASVQGQSFTDLEILLVDDGSTDGSAALCDTLAGEDARIRVIHKENGGASTARNAGISQSTGQWILFLDSDDYYDSPLLIERLLNYGTDLVCFNMKKLNNSTGQLGEAKINFSGTLNGDISEDLCRLTAANAYSDSACLKLVRASVIKENDVYFVDGLLGEDIRWNALLMPYVGSVSFHDGDYYVYRMVNDSASNRRNQKQLEDLINTVDWMVHFSHPRMADAPFARAFYCYAAFNYCTTLLNVWYGEQAYLKENLRRLREYKGLLKYDDFQQVKLVQVAVGLCGLRLASWALYRRSLLVRKRYALHTKRLAGGYAGAPRVEAGPPSDEGAVSNLGNGGGANNGCSSSFSGGEGVAGAICPQGAGESAPVSRGRLPIKVAMVLGDMNSGGIESVVTNYLRYLPKESFKVDVLLHEGSSFPQREEFDRLGIGHHLIPAYSKVVDYQKALRRLFSQEGYDIVHSHISSMSGFPLLAAKKAGVRVRICHNHTTAHKGEGLKTLAKYLLRPFARHEATHYVACGEVAGRWLYGNKCFDGGGVTVLYNAIDFPVFIFDEDNRRQVREALDFGPENLVVGNVGRFMYQKNHQFLIEIFVEVHKLRPEARLALAGEGPLMEEIKALVKEKGLEDRVRFLGVRRDVARLYSAMDVFCLPSFYEGMPTVAVESYANGLPMLCSTEVTDEVEQFSSISRLGLEVPAQEWAKLVIEKGLAGKERLPQLPTGPTREMFDAQYQAARLAGLYERMVAGEL